MPEIDFFRLPVTRHRLEAILFVFCKLNPDLSYRQGMHELLAPILYAVDTDSNPPEKDMLDSGRDSSVETILDSKFVEHDAFTLFSQVMQNAKVFYESTTHAGSDNPLVAKSSRIIEDLLAQIDPALSQHLVSIGLAPQIFLIRWLRLLFGREFAFYDLLSIWDVIFADEQSLELVDYICVVMLLRIRWKLLASDHNEALSLVLRYPALEPGLSGRSLALDAVRARSDLSVSMGSSLIEKYTGQKPVQQRQPFRSSTSRSASTLTVLRNRGKLNAEHGSSEAVTKETSDLEAMMRSTMKNIYDRGEQLGIGRAVRGAVEDIHRRAQEIKEARTSERHQSRQTESGTVPDVGSRMVALEGRNTRLSSMLDAAVSDLWSLQKELLDRRKDAEEVPELDRLSLAIGRVQFVQIHLQDGTLPLPRDELVPENNDSVDDEASKPASIADAKLKTSGPPPIRQEYGFRSAASDADNVTQDIDYHSSIQAAANTSTGPAPSIVRERPLLTESSYSWMLGQSESNEEQSERQSLKRPESLFPGSHTDKGVAGVRSRRSRRPQKSVLESVLSSDAMTDT